MKKVIKSIFLLFMILLVPAVSASEKCTYCHKQNNKLSPFHNPKEIGCVICHSGNPESELSEIAHQNLEAYPGRMATVKKSCGSSGCHEQLIPIVENSLMNTVSGMISITRHVLDEENNSVADSGSLVSPQHLKNHGTDQYLRKLCVSCHLGSERKNHQQSLKDRGGGCSACHLKTFKSDEHPQLSLKIHNDRCFGCHSRSGRISLNYVGLAETDEVDPENIKNFGRIPDGRLVQKRPIDVHSRANMSCIDCHTATGVMGNGKPGSRQLDIACKDCHAKNPGKKPLSKLSQREALYSALTPHNFHIQDDDAVFSTQKNDTPLFHVFEKKGKRFLQGKVSSIQKEIPLMQENLPQHSLKGHERLSCDSCHSAWAPQCYGCHIEYDPTGKQWDHLEKKKTPGRWKETRWGVYSEAPALGVDSQNRITPFVPGMNMLLKISPEEKTQEIHLYASISPHTTQRFSRSCASCHENDKALGIITKEIAHPKQQHWVLPLGWIPENSVETGKASKSGERSFNQQEIKKIRRVGKCLKCHIPDHELYLDFQKSLKSMPKDSSHGNE